MARFLVQLHPAVKLLFSPSRHNPVCVEAQADRRSLRVHTVAMGDGSAR